MQFSTQNFNVIYIDPSQTENGDGLTPTTALNNLPSVVADFQDNTCYLIRRTSSEFFTQIPSGTNNLINNIMFLGMPKSSDLIYGFIPDAAKVAWDNDEAEYANIQSSATLDFTMQEIKIFVMHRVYLFRSNTISKNYIFKLYNSKYQSCVNIEHCKFGNKDLDIDQDDFTADSITKNYLHGYIYVSSAKIFNLKNCILNFSSFTDGLDGIVCYNYEILNVENIEIYSLLGLYSYYPLSFSSASNNIECKVVNIHQHLKFNGSASVIPPLLKLYGALNNIIDNISVEFISALNEIRPTNLSLNTKMIYFDRFGDFSIKNINVNLPYFWNIDYSDSILNLENAQIGTLTPGILKEISNINITLGEDEDNCIGNSNTFENAKSEYYSAVRMQFAQSSFTYKIPVVDNITITHPRGSALYISNARLTNASIKGTVFCDNILADIDLLETWYPSHILTTKRGSSVRVQELKVNLLNEDYPYNQEPAVINPFTNTSTVFVEKSNCMLNALVPLSDSTDNVYPYQGTICNNEKEEGNFVQRSTCGTCDTWNIYREGGADASLKIYNNLYSSQKTMVLGRRPFKGMLLQPTTTGRHLLKMHIALEEYGLASDMDFRFIVSVTADNKTYYSSNNGRWIDDSSAVWVNHDALDKKCLEMPIDLVTTNPVDVKIYFTWYSPSGAIYVDPNIELVKESE